VVVTADGVHELHGVDSGGQLIGGQTCTAVPSAAAEAAAADGDGWVTYWTHHSSSLH